MCYPKSDKITESMTTQLQRGIQTGLCFLLPALLSFSSINPSKIEESEAWLRYWIVLAFALLLELLLDHYLEGNYPKVQIVVKLVFILCLLSPCDQNGSTSYMTRYTVKIKKVSGVTYPLEEGSEPIN